MLEEIRIAQLGVIESSTLELGPGLTVITGETGAGKTMVVTALGLLLGGRADSGAVRTGAGVGRVEGVVRRRARWPAFGAAVDDAGGEVEDGRVVLARNVSAEGRSRAFVGGASVPVSRLAEVAEPLVAVHGQSDQHRLLQPAGPARGAGPVRRRAGARAAGGLRRPARPAGGDRARARRGRRQRPGAGPGGRPAAVRARRDRGGRPRSRVRTPSSRPTRPGSATPTRCAPPPSRPARRCPARPATPTRWPPTSAARTLLDGVREHDRRGRRSWPTGWPRSPTCSPTWPPTWRRTPPRSTTDPARLAAVSERRAALTALTRKYGETVDEVLAWAEASADPAPRPRRHRRAHRGRCAPSSARSGPSWASVAADPVRGPHRGRRAALAARSPPSSPCSRCRTPASRSPCPSTTRTRRPETAAGR